LQYEIAAAQEHNSGLQIASCKSALVLMAFTAVLLLPRYFHETLFSDIVFRCQYEASSYQAFKIF